MKTFIYSDSLGNYYLKARNIYNAVDKIYNSISRYSDVTEDIKKDIKENLIEINSFPELLQFYRDYHISNRW